MTEPRHLRALPPPPPPPKRRAWHWALVVVLVVAGSVTLTESFPDENPVRVSDAVGSTGCLQAEPIPGLPFLDVEGLCPEPEVYREIPADYWPLAKARWTLVSRVGEVAGRDVRAARCSGVGVPRWRGGVKFFHRFDCTVRHPGTYRSYVRLVALDVHRYRVRVEGGIG